MDNLQDIVVNWSRHSWLILTDTWIDIQEDQEYLPLCNPFQMNISL